MCLQLHSDFHPNNAPLIAEEDLYVYKIIGYCFGSTYGPFTGIKLRLNTLLQIDINVKKDSTIGPHIDLGYHAIFFMDNVRDKPYDTFYPVIAMIPKGTKYYIGIVNDIVAEQMIIPIQKEQLNAIDCRALIKEYMDNGAFVCPQLKTSVIDKIGYARLTTNSYDASPIFTARYLP